MTDAEPKPNGAEVVIDARNLTKTFNGRAVVRDFSLRVNRGQIYGFLGPNGSGKTTTIRMLCGLLTPDGGGGYCLGFDLLRDSAQIKRQVGYMTQKFSLYEDLTIAENLDFVARLYAVPKRRQVVDQALDRLGLGRRRHQLAGSLSGGWKQRLALAACILHQPKLLLLDEPTAGVDPKARRDFWDQIHGLAADGLTVLVSTHYMDEAERCHRIAYLAYGALLANGTVDEVIDGSGLVTRIASGDGLAALAAQLAGAPGIDQIAPFGTTLHVGGIDQAALDAALARFQSWPGVSWSAGRASLEDVFILLMSQAKDNFQ